jgi:hypothetical protein
LLLLSSVLVSTLVLASWTFSLTVFFSSAGLWAMLGVLG